MRLAHIFAVITLTLPALYIAQTDLEATRIIKHLVLEGGGVKGIAYIGAFKAFEDVGLFANGSYKFESVTGTSAGCLFGSMVALNIPTAKLFELVMKTDFDGDFFDYKFSDLMSLPYPPSMDYTYVTELVKWISKLDIALTKRDSFGLNTGDKYMKFWRTKILPLSPYATKMSDDPTFAELDSASPIALNCFSARLKAAAAIEYSVRTTPNMRVSHAILHSGDLPVMIKPTMDHFGCTVVDGGLYKNFPINFFDTATYTDPHVLGLSLNTVPPTKATEGCNPTQVEMVNGSPIIYSKISIKDYIVQLLDGLISAHDILTYASDPRNRDRIIFLDPQITTISFSINGTVRSQVIDRARTNVINYFKAKEAQASSNIAFKMSAIGSMDVSPNTILEHYYMFRGQRTPTIAEHLLDENPSSKYIEDYSNFPNPMERLKQREPANGQNSTGRVPAPRITMLGV